MVAGDEDEEEEVEMSGKRKKKKQGGGGAKRKLRAGGLDRGRAPKSFQRILEESMMERLPQGIPCYTNAAAGPPLCGAPRKFCSVCGNLSSYKCTRCGSRYCCRRCYSTHTETRCLKFLV
ncbi:hypothetical protein DUNSADRAFT_2537 [Dunaliella salina]|uniref:HIT-type domain-containing protein n=1 Tax=Dunaliella salina TaxID=3046 RepID=A0ABQ7FWJ5_DUNSA|nr:hypothetical protein DUNSADRAFT_2537 [Dunaliella salina]|eukprot:KAF5826617.1 hypothetical protein DUNSADRAFT_2537 [Dunaliella salina]